MSWLGAAEDADDDESFQEELTQATTVWCPYCGEAVELSVDPAGGAVQDYVEDCQVCCQPWSVRLSVDHEGQPLVQVTTLDEG